MRDFKLKPARDVELPLHRRTSDVRRESGLFGWLCHCVTAGLLRGYLKFYHRLVIHGYENIPAEPPYVLIANHTSHLDALVMTTLVSPRYRGLTYPLAAGDVFFESRSRATISTLLLNLLPVRRSRADRHALEHLRNRLVEDGLIYILYPEGTRNSSSELGSFKPGIGTLVAGSDIAVVPCYLVGCDDALAKGRCFPFPTPIRVRVGKPMRFESVQNDRTGWKDIAERLRAAVVELQSQEDPGQISDNLTE